MISHNIIKRKPRKLALVPVSGGIQRTQEEVDKFIDSFEYKVGDLFTWDYGVSPLTPWSIHLLTKIERDLNVLLERWYHYNKYPNCFFLVGLGKFNSNNPETAYSRWDDAKHLRRLTEEERRSLDDKLQDYIQTLLK